MQIASRMTAASTGDGLGNLAGRAATQTGTSNSEEAAILSARAGSYDPSSRVSLSAEALLFLSRAKRAPERQPALTPDEWANKLTPQLAAREEQAFGKYGDTGDYKAYYRSFIEYYDNLRVEDQNSLRYFGTRDAAVAALRSLDYDGELPAETGQGFQTLVSVLLQEDKAGGEAEDDKESVNLTTGDMFGWDTGNISYEEDFSETRSTVSEIEKFYQETF